MTDTLTQRQTWILTNGPFCGRRIMVEYPGRYLEIPVCGRGSTVSVVYVYAGMTATRECLAVYEGVRQEHA